MPRSSFDSLEIASEATFAATWTYRMKQSAMDFATPFADRSRPLEQIGGGGCLEEKRENEVGKRKKRSRSIPSATAACLPSTEGTCKYKVPLKEMDRVA